LIHCHSVSKWYTNIISFTPYQTLVTTDFFEQSNHGSAIYGFLENMQIPIIENFDAHMLSQSIGGIIYGLFNGDSIGAIFVGYSLTPIFIIILYYVICMCFNNRISFLILLFTPILADYTYSLYAFGLVSIVVTINLYNKKDKKDYYIYWICLAITCIYRLDIGMAYGVCSVVVYLLMYVIKKHKDILELKRCFISFVITTTMFLIVYFVVCMIKDINPINRALEFINIANSNINWSYSYWGDTNLIAYSICYLIFPVAVIVLLLISTYKKIINNNSISDNQFIILLIIGLGYILNLSRGIVRHSLAENIQYFVISSVVLFFSLYYSFYSDKHKLQRFIFAEISMLIIVNLLLRPNIFESPTLLNAATTKLNDASEYYEAGNNKKERVVISDSMKEIYVPLKTIFDELLDSDETYLDFTNQTLLYSLLQRSKPVYVNQSPGLLSGEYSQQQFIEQIENSEDDVTFVLMPLRNFGLSDQLDGIPNSYRYYLVSEYISNNYSPLLSNNDFAVWCRNDLYNEKLNEAKNFINNNMLSQNIADFKTYDFLYTNEAAILNRTNDNLILEAVSTDPQLMGLENDTKLKELFLENKNITISLAYESNVEGIVQMFYTTEQDETFSEDKSIIKEASSGGEVNFTISCSEFTKLRLDVPENSKFIIKRIIYSSEEFPKFNLIDYSYLGIDKHIYNLNYIPYIWGNYDEISYTEVDNREQYTIAENIIINSREAQYFNIDFKDIDKSEGNYILLDINSSQVGNMQITFGNKEGDFKPKNIFNFTLKDIERGKYILRVSSDFMWYTNEIDSIQITSDVNASLNSVKLIKGDTIKPYGYNISKYEKQKGIEENLFIQASDLTDNNWIRGINNEFDIILFSNNDYNLSKLVNATAIKIKETVATIESVDIVNGWIHVKIQGNKEAFSYPNIIEVIKGN
uniref:hypothetical protein n=1 Tax=Sedimentibacter saalensis TaxID=130788 RepID=UPI0028A2843A